MKKLVFIIYFLPLVSVAQNSYTVCNAPGIKADYFTLQGAIDSVAAGSVLYLFPSPNSYGSVTLQKKLSIFGTGYMLDQNSEPAASPNTSGVTLNAINFKPGSNNSYIDGLQFNEPSNVITYRFYLDSVSNITISHCMASTQDNFSSIIFYSRNSTGCSINQCYFLLSLNPLHSFAAFYREQGDGSQIQFNNNIIDGRFPGIGMTMNSGLNSQKYGNLIFSNNLFYINLGGSAFSNYTYRDNFFINNYPQQAINQSIIFMNGTSMNNITNAPNLFPAPGNNIQNANADSIFVYSTFGYHSWDEKWKVRDTSFAKTYSSNGGEVGAYGGSNSYKLSGLSPLPYIYNLTITRDPAIRGNVKVHIKAKANY
jgi:hypothetical protein